jgi:class 3 adenylate cyclase/tetratricopeptide (TPR) repeat protein
MTPCPNCGSENTEGARFCSTCGHSLLTRVAVEERRHVTAFFADLVASTALSNRLDPEVVRNVVSGFFERATAEIRRHGGSVEKFSGDAVMALFGLQQAHEDDPERAVRAAFAARDALAELAPAAADRHGIVLQVRIGIEAGEVVVGDPFGGATMATGDPLNLAARLEQHAAPGEIVVGPAVHAATVRAIAYEPAGAWELQGKAEAVEAWRALQPMAEPGDARGIEGHEAPLTGRSEEIALLRDAARRTRGDSKAILFTIIGLPGVGKSRLVRELGAELRADGWSVLRGRCLPYGEGITYWPIAEIVRDLAEIDPQMTGAEALVKLEAASPDPETANRLALAIGLESTATSGEGLDRDIAFAFRRLVETATATAPVLLVVEDIHWAETPLLDLLEYVATWARERPILILCLARPDLFELRPGWGSGRMEASRLQLEPLTRDQTAELVRALLQVEGLPAALREQVLDRAEGNPLFVEETIRMLIERGAVIERDGRWVAAESISEIEVPESIEALIRARLDALPRDERSVLQGASVIGRVFQLSAVATLIEEPVERQLEQAVLRDIVSEEVAPDPSYRFKHIAIRDVAYATLPKARRAELHRRVVDWLTGWAGDRLAEFVEIEAYHLEQAALLTRELDGSADPDLVRRAVASLRQSADKAESRGDPRGLVGFAERALELDPPPGELRLELETMLAEGYFQRGDVSRAAQLGARVAAEAEAIGRRDLRGRMLLLMAHEVWIGPGHASDKNRAMILLADAVEDLHAAGDLAHEAEVRIFQAYDGWWDGDVEKAATAWGQAADVARQAGDAGRETRALIMESRARWSLGQLPEMEALTRRATELAPTTSRLTQSKVWVTEADRLWDSGADLERARSMFADAYQVAEEADDFAARYIALGDLARTSYEAGDLDAAASLLEEVVEMVESVHHLGWIPEAQRQLAQVLLEMGDVDGAEVHALRAIEVVAPDDTFSVASSKMALGRVRDQQGRPLEAAELLTEAVDIGHRIGFLSQQPEFDLALGVFQLANGRSAEGEATLAVVRRQVTELYGPKSPSLGFVDRQEAAARARATARPEDARN